MKNDNVGEEIWRKKKKNSNSQSYETGQTNYKHEYFYQ